MSARASHAKIQLSDRDLRRMGKSGADEAPPINLRDWTNLRTSEVSKVPAGSGWDYAQGASRSDSARAVLREKAVAASPDMRAAALDVVSRKPYAR